MSSDQEGLFEPQELFFSTTDGRGVIERANSVFVRLSKHPWQELVGAPHNIIRHDDMPGGAFKIMWDTLKRGRPFCAYVKNAAADGSPYTVFATITPLGDGYLSVRQLPCAVELRDTAFSLYRDARAVERASGKPGPAAAVEGAERLAELLRGVGMESYDDFVLASLPAEVSARRALVGPLPERAGDGGLQELYRNVRLVDHALESWLGELDTLAALATRLQQTATHLDDSMTGSLRIAQQVAHRSGAAGAPVMLAVSVWASMMPEIKQAIDGLTTEVRELAASCARTRFRIALASLHNDTAAQFVLELLDAAQDGSTPAGSGRPALVELATALDEGLRDAAAQSAHNAELARGVAEQCAAVRDLVLVPQGLLGNWQQAVVSSEDDEAHRLQPVMAERLSDGDRTCVALTELAQHCLAAATTRSVEEFVVPLSEVRRLAGAAVTVDEGAEAMLHGSSRPSRGVMDEHHDGERVVAQGPRRGIA